MEESEYDRKKDRHRQIRKEAIRSRDFSQEELTRQAVEFILFGLSIDRNRNEIIKSTREVND